MSLTLFGISLLNVFATQNIFLWQASVLSSEYGHYLALVSLALALCVVFKVRDIRLLVLNIFSFLAFLIPMAQALQLESHFREDFSKAFQTPMRQNSLISIREAYFKKDLDKVPFERFVFKKSPDRNLNLDLYRNVKNSEASPWLLVIHGGGWNGGDSEQLPDLNWYLARHGYSVIAITYDFSPKHQWPTQKEDVALAMDFINAHALEFNIDPLNFFVLGRSAGGQLAGVLAYTYSHPGIRGYIGFYSPSDLSFGYDAGDEDDILKSRGLIRDFLGGTAFEKPDAYKDASVIESFESTHKPVPTLLFHGDLDRLVWFKHSERLQMHLMQKHIPQVFVRLPWATHGFDFNLSGPGGQISTQLVEYFMNHYSK